MTHAQIKQVCLAKPGAFLDHPFGPQTDIIKVRAQNNTGRIFAQLFVLKGEPCVTLNCEEMTGEFYRQLYPGSVQRGYHCPAVQQPYFNTVRLNGGVPDEELLLMIAHAYETVVKKLPRYLQKQLQEEDEKCNP